MNSSSMDATSFEPENLTTVFDLIFHHKDSSFGIFYTCICTVTFIVGFIGNGLVIFLTGCRMKTTVNSFWFLNLAITDFIFISAFIIIHFIGYFLLNEFLIIIFQIVITLNQFASVFFLVVISLDRCLCTWMAVWAQNNRTVFRARLVCLIVWVSSIGCCILYVTAVMFYFLHLYLTYQFLVGFLIPFLIIASSYIAIGVRIKRLKMGKQLSSSRVITAVVLTFFICCFPYHVFFLCAMLMGDFSASDEIMSISVYLLYLNSALNPVLYVFMCDEYKKKLKQSLLLVLETAFAEDHLDVRERPRMNP